MRLLCSIFIAATMLAACAAPGASPSPSALIAPATAPPIASTAALASPRVTIAPSPDPTPTPPTVTPKPAPTPAPVAGWPAVSHAGITMTGAVEDHGEIGDRLRIPITVTGLAPGKAVALRATGEYSFEWACGSAPGPCGELGCGPAVRDKTEGTAEASDRAVAGSDGTAAARIELVAAPPAEPCPADIPSSWSMEHARWEKVRIADPVHGLVLTPDAIEWGITY